MEMLFGDKRTNVLLIQKGQRTPELIIQNMAEYLSADLSFCKANVKRLIKFEVIGDGELIYSENSDKWATTISLVFEEAANAGNIILFINGIDRFMQNAIGTAVKHLLRSKLASEAFQCIGGLNEDGYHQLMAEDREWIRLFRPLWMHDLKQPLRL